MNRLLNEKLEALRHQLESGGDWGGSDQRAMNQSIHKALGSPKTAPLLGKVIDAAGDAVDFYWDDWAEYRSDRKGLVMNAARRYYDAFFPDFMKAARAMFGS